MATLQLREDAEDDELVECELRFDVATGELDNLRRTPQGGLRVHANIARTGVQLYRNADGTTRREYRPPEEVFSEATLDSFAHAPVTVDHPRGLVDPDNWQRVSVGHMAGRPERDGIYAAGDLDIQHGPAIRDARNDKLREVSCGYQCRLDMTPGVSPEGELYDAVQRDIRGNHIALGPRGWGRAGPAVQMHLDGGEWVSGTDFYVPAMPTAVKPGTTTPPTTTPGAGGTREDAGLAGENAALKDRIAALERESAERQDAEQTDEEQARVDALADERAEVLAVVRPVLTKADAKWSHAGKNNDTLRREYLAKVAPNTKLRDAREDGAEAYVTGVFRVVAERGDASAQAIGKTRVASPSGGRAKTGAAPTGTTQAPEKPGARSDAGAGDVEETEQRTDTIGDRADAATKRLKDRWKTKPDRTGGAR